MRDDTHYPTIRQTARRGPLSERCLRAMLKSGNLPGFYVGAHYRVDYELLMEKLRDTSMKGGRHDAKVTTTE